MEFRCISNGYSIGQENIPRNFQAGLRFSKSKTHLLYYLTIRPWLSERFQERMEIQ